MKRIAILIAIFLGLLAAVARADSWNIDPAHTNVGFKVRHMMVTNVKGSFTRFAGTVEMDEKNLARSKVSVTIEPASIDTGITARDNHLRSPDFFDVAKYPTMGFVSTKVEVLAADRLRVSGNLTMHGVTRPVVLEVQDFTPAVKDPSGMLRRGASATAVVSRKDFGLLYNTVLESGGVAIGDEVTILIEVSLVKK